MNIYPLHIGYTGTQRGMTERQKAGVRALIAYRDAYVHHGCCIGGDQEFDEIARQVRSLRGVIIHPASGVGDKQARCPIDPIRDVVRAEKPPLLRNRDIVDETVAMIAAPKGMAMQLRSGTWTTVRYARELGRPLAIVFPNGAVVYDGGVWP